MFKNIGSIFVTGLGLLLLVYSAIRSLNFIGLTLPPDQQGLAFFALAALDGGLIAWLRNFEHGAKGGWQRAIALIMVVVDMLGCIAMFTLDGVYQTGQNGLTSSLSPDDIQTGVMGLSIIIGLNIAAVVAHSLLDPDNLRRAAEEEAISKIESETLRAVEKDSAQLAAEIAPMVAADWSRNMRARWLAGIGTGEIPRLNAQSSAQQVVNAVSRDVAAPEPAQPPAPKPAAIPVVEPANAHPRVYHAETVDTAPEPPTPMREKISNQKILDAIDGFISRVNADAERLDARRAAAREDAAKVPVVAPTEYRTDAWTDPESNPTPPAPI